MKYLCFIGIGIIALILQQNVSKSSQDASYDVQKSVVVTEQSDAVAQENIFSDAFNNNMTEKDSVNFAIDNLAKIFGIDAQKIQGEAEYYENSAIQPDGWFVQLYDSNWDYAVWIEPSNGRVKFSRGSSSHPMKSISTDEMNKIMQDNTWLDNAKKIISKNLNDPRKIVDIYFDSQNGISEYRSIDITIVLEDGYSYTLSYYSDGILKSLLYF